MRCCWLIEQPADASALKRLLRAFPLGRNDLLVTAQVGNVKNNDPSLI
jgi:hypothetical protein